jgi:SRSO17 transposase
LLDRELYLPKEWTDDRQRCQIAGIPEERAFATKPHLAKQMLQRAREAGLRLAFITGDSVYGDDAELRSSLEEQQQAYVLARSLDEYVWSGTQQRTIASILAELNEQDWLQLSAGAGSKGERMYEWQELALFPPADTGWRRWLLFRRSLSERSDVAAYSVFALSHTSIKQHVQVAGKRWTVEESIQCGKGEVGLDHYEVRSWRGWYRHITLAMLASAFLTVVRAESGTQPAPFLTPAKTGGMSSLARFKAMRNLHCH